MGGDFQGDFKSRFTSTTIKSTSYTSSFDALQGLTLKFRRSSPDSQVSVFMCAFTQDRCSCARLRKDLTKIGTTCTVTFPTGIALRALTTDILGTYLLE